MANRNPFFIFEELRKAIRANELRARWNQLILEHSYLKGIPYWVGAAFVGFVAVAYSAAFSRAIDFAGWVREFHPFWLFALTPSCFVLGSLLVQKVAPSAGGTGTPRVIEALTLSFETKQQDLSRLLNLRVVFIIMASSLLCAAGGGALGREGPMIHIAACLFYVIGSRLRGWWPFEEHRSWIIAGGAAGIAAAFNAPLAGVVFVLEELSQQHFHQFKSVVITAAIVGGVVSQWLSGKYLFLGIPLLHDIPLSSLPWSLALGLVCGALAFPFHRMLYPQFQRLFRKHFNTQVKFSVFSGVIVASLSVYVSRFSIGGGINLVEHLLFDFNSQASLKDILARFIGPIVSHLSGNSGGFLAPALALGGAIGSYFAQVTSYSDPRLLVIVGMSAFLSAIIRAPFTGWVIVMEMTGSQFAVFPLMLASLVGSGTLRFLESRFQTTENKTS